MKNLTLAVHDDFLDRVRVIAAERKTTVNGLVREYLGKLANEEARLADTRKRLRELMDNSTAELGPDYVWDRGEIYADRMFPRHEHRDLRGGRKRHEPAKHEIARHIIPGTRFCLSGQVLAEFYVNVTTKPRIRLTLPEIDEWLDLLDRYPVAAVDAALADAASFSLNAPSLTISTRRSLRPPSASARPSSTPKTSITTSFTAPCGS